RRGASVGVSVGVGVGVSLGDLVDVDVVAWHAALADPRPPSRVGPAGSPGDATGAHAGPRRRAAEPPAGPGFAHAGRPAGRQRPDPGLDPPGCAGPPRAERAGRAGP